MPDGRSADPYLAAPRIGPSHHAAMLGQEPQEGGTYRLSADELAMTRTPSSRLKALGYIAGGTRHPSSRRDAPSAVSAAEQRAIREAWISGACSPSTGQSA